MSNYKSLFEIPEDIIYLNTAGSGLIPTAIKKWRGERDALFFNTAGDLREQQGAFMNSVKETIANFINAERDQLYASSNFSTALITVLNGLPKDTEFLLLEADYPSLNFPIISRGFKHSFVPLDTQLEQHIYEAVKTRKPQVLALSLVQYISGLQVDLTFLQALKQEFPALLIIADGTQYLGAAALDFAQSGIDIFAASGYKWLLSGYGNGFVAVSAYAKEILYRDAKMTALEKMWEGRDLLSLYFEPGHTDTLAHGTLQKSIELLTSLGMPAVERHIQNLTSTAAQEFQKRHLIAPELSLRKQQSPLFNLQIDQAKYPFFLEKGVKCFPRGKGIRIAFHLYNDEQDLERLLKIIDNGKI